MSTKLTTTTEGDKKEKQQQEKNPKESTDQVKT